MNEVNISNEALNAAIVQELQLLGIKHGLISKRSLKITQMGKVSSGHGHVFSKPLHRLPSRIMTLSSGVKAEVPVFVTEVCMLILKHADVEGLFRKAGSSSRQKELKIILNEGQKVDFSQHHVIDVANLLKSFLRDLPEPLLPFTFHDPLLHCLLLEEPVEAILLICLLLPRTYLHALAYIMEFFQTIAGFSSSNKMDVSNLAIVLAPSLMPVTTKVSVIHNPQRLTAHVHVVQLLISNAEKIGVLPDGVVSRLSLTPSVSSSSLVIDEQNLNCAEGFSFKKKRRRSGSLTRMFNGLKKIVAGKISPERETDVQLEEQTALISTPDFSTPCVKASKKRKASETTSAFSSKKKRDVLQSLPQSTALANTPFKHSSGLQDIVSYTTPNVCPHPNPMSQSPPKVNQRKIFTARIELEKLGALQTRKGLSGVSSLVSKKQKQHSERRSAGGSFLERSWSAVSSSNWGRRKCRQSDQNRLSLASTTTTCETSEEYSSQDIDTDNGVDLSEEDPSISSPSDFVRVPKSEYEQLKSRMSAIESRISQEFGCMTAEDPSSPEALEAAKSALAVQTAYEKTLEGADLSKDSSADLLAKRLSRELKIRRSSDCKVIRSPSARKIGSLRRRSRERQSPSIRRELRRNKSWHNMHRPSVSVLATADTPQNAIVHGSSLRRGRPNTIFSGLPHPTPSRVCKESSPKSQTRRTSSFHSGEPTPLHISLPKKCNSQVTLAKAALALQACRRNGSTDEVWHDALELLSKSKGLLEGAPASGRESIAKLRNENAGKVLATAKLFNASTDAVKSVETRGSRASEEISTCLQPEEEIISSANDEGKMENKQINNLMSVTSSGKPIGRATRFPSKRHENNSSPRKLPTPHIMSLRHKSPNSSSLSERPKVTSVLHEIPIQKLEQQRVKKYYSLKTEKRKTLQPVKRNASAPVQAGKENVLRNASQNTVPYSPLLVKDASQHAERAKKMSVSPLRDRNRISAQTELRSASKALAKPTCNTPNIKCPLTSKSPRLKSFTPQNARVCSGQTPLRVHTPVVAISRRQSPRLMHQRVALSKQLA